MKTLIKYLIVLLLLNANLNAQPPRDTAWGSWPNQEYYDGVLQAPVVTGETSAQLITPTGQKLCFDKKLKIKTLLSSGPVEQCMYLNTQEGYIGLLPPSRTGGDICDIKTDDPKFLLFVLGLKGNAYTFRNNEKNGTMEHWVSTGNTQTHQLNMMGPAGEYILHKKTERRGYCGDKIKTWAYKHDNPSSPVYFLFGKIFPDEITVTSNKYIGNFGVGYQFTDKGLFIMMEMESGGYDCKITDLEEVNICFDPAPFKIAEDEFFVKRQAGLQREREKIDRDEAKASTGDCSSEKMEVINFRKEQLRIQEASLYTSQQGNTYQDPVTQQAMLQMMDQTAMAEQAILEIKVQKCQTQKRLSETSNQTSRDKYQQKLSCLSQQEGELLALKEQLIALDSQYASEPGRAFAEKAKLFFRNMPRGCN